MAERAIRPAVLWRKGSFGTQSGSGARFAGAMLTVAATCRMHGLDLFAYLAGVCTASMADLAVPQLLPAPACLQAAPDVAEPVTRCAFPTNPRETVTVSGTANPISTTVPLRSACPRKPHT